MQPAPARRRAAASSSPTTTATASSTCTSTRTGQPGSNVLAGRQQRRPAGNRLYRNLGDWQFEDVTKASGAGGGRRSTFTAAWLDANNDGWPDLHVPNEFGDGVLLVNNSDGTFRPQPLADRPADFGTMGLAVGDVDNDGRIDLYCANMYSKAGHARDRQPGAGRLPADGDGEVAPLRRRQPAAPEQGRPEVRAGRRRRCRSPPSAGPTAPCLADLDNDGWLDVYAHGRVHQPRPRRTGRVKLRLAGCRVTALQPQRRGPAARQARRSRSASSGSATPGRSSPTGTTSAASSGTASTSTSAGKDFLDVSHLTGADSDGDGRVGRGRRLPQRRPCWTCSSARPAAGRCCCTRTACRARHYLTVSLRGRASNRQGIGARLTAVVERASSMSASCTRPTATCRRRRMSVHFGLGDAAEVDSLTIRWPSGKVQVLENLTGRPARRHRRRQGGPAAVEVVVPGRSDRTVTQAGPLRVVAVGVGTEPELRIPAAAHFAVSPWSRVLMEKDQSTDELKGLSPVFALTS